MFLILPMEDGMNVCRRSRIEQDELTVGRGSDEISQAFPRPFQFLFIIYDRRAVSVCLCRREAEQ